MTGLTPKTFHKQTLNVPRRMVVPEWKKRSVNISPNFLCDNAAYVLGLSSNGVKFGMKRFEAFRLLHKKLLAQADCDAARAVIAFLENHDPENLSKHPAVVRHLEELLNKTNIVFLFRGMFVHQDPDICRAWENYNAGAEAEWGQCLVTGEMAPIARLHQNFHGVRGAQASGAALVSFNAPAYESYNQKQGQIAPVSLKAAAGYGAILTFLLSSDNPNPKVQVGDNTTVVYWAEGNRTE